MILTLDLLCALSKLTPKQREVLLDRVLLGDPMQEIADRIGCSRSSVGLTEQSAMRRVRAELRRIVPPRDLLEAA